MPLTGGIIATDPGGLEMLALIDSVAAAGGRMIGPSHWRGIGAMPRKPDFDGLRIYQRGLPPNPTVNEVAAVRGSHRSRR